MDPMTDDAALDEAERLFGARAIAIRPNLPAPEPPCVVGVLAVPGVRVLGVGHDWHEALEDAARNTAVGEGVR